MHPMFKQLFLQTDADDLLAEQDRRRRVSRARRARPAVIIRARRPQRTAPAAVTQPCCVAGQVIRETHSCVAVLARTAADRR